MSNDLPTEVGRTVYSTPSDVEVRFARLFAAPVALVWSVHTDPKHVPNWMGFPDGWTMPVCEIDARTGGRWRYMWRKADGTEMAMQGEYSEVVPLRRLVTTESWGPEWPATLNTTEFVERGPGLTLLTITIRYPSKDARDAAMATGAREGLDVSFARLDALLATV